jgi:zona occludens toxin (predicted ATPase)
MLEGVPGAGKSYHAVAEFLLPWVRQHRRVYLYIDGMYLDRLAAFEGRTMESLSEQITLWRSPEEVLSGLPHVEPGSGVLIDECQTLFRAKAKLEPELLRWLETHRHYGVDVVLLCQHFKQVTSGVTRLVEVTLAFRRLDRFGLKNRYQAKVRGNPEEVEIIRQFTGKYEATVWSYYSSYAAAAIKETKRGGSLLKSPTVILGVIGLGIAVWWFSSGAWLSGASAVRKDKDKVAATLPASAVDILPAKVQVSAASDVSPLRIQGGIVSDKGRLWITPDGNMLTEEEIAAESGGTVIPYAVRGVWRLKGSGVKYGSEGLAAQPSPVVDGPPAAAPAVMAPRPVTAAQPLEVGPADPFATPIDPMNQPFTLQTPSAPLPRPVR